jgi:hypothetical protein
MASNKPKPTLSSFSVKPVAVAAAPELAAAPESGEDRKLTTLRFTQAQRRYLRRIAFDEETTLQDWIVAAIDARLASKGLGTLESVKA